VLKLPQPRITELYKGERRLKLDEAQALVSHYRLQEVGGLAEPVARLAVLHVAESLGARIPADDPRLEEIALDLKELSEFAARPEVRQEVAQVSGFLAGRKTKLPNSAASK
jgi:hypothetical protein